MELEAGPPLVLLVEQQPELRAALGSQLIHGDFTVVGVSDGDAALRELDFGTASVAAIVATETPSSDLTRQARLGGFTGPILVLSSRPDAEPVDGADDVLPRTAATERLVDVLSGLFGRSPGGRA